MRNEIVGIMSPFLSAFLRPRTIHRIEDGRRVNEAVARDLRGLSETTLQDIGFTRCAG